MSASLRRWLTWDLATDFSWFYRGHHVKVRKLLEVVADPADEAGQQRKSAEGEPVALTGRWQRSRLFGICESSRMSGMMWHASASCSLLAIHSVSSSEKGDVGENEPNVDLEVVGDQPASSSSAQIYPTHL